MRPSRMRYCQCCVYPQVSVNLELDQEGICSACRTAQRFHSLTDEFWQLRQARFEKIIGPVLAGNNSNYDCIIPVSGGKDSYYQAHIICKQYGLKPLFVTYHGNNYLPEGDWNRDRMRQVFDADHLTLGPSISTLKKLNRLCFRRMGDMNWHAHCGIFTVPVIAAVQQRIPLIIWGEIAWDISGMFDPDDFVEFSARVRHEHALRGFEWYDLIGDTREPLTEKDLLWARYPSDREILDLGVTGLYIGNFFRWDANRHARQMIEEHGWKPSSQPFERTYRIISNLDDRYENGVHDLLKYIKFGYGRCSDHVSKDIRDGYLSREEGIELVRRYDHVVSSDLYHWLDYVGMHESEFWDVANGFRDPRVWWRDFQGNWCKDNIWD